MCGGGVGGTVAGGGSTLARTPVGCSDFVTSQQG